MSDVDLGFADWLKSPALYSPTANGALAAGLLPSAIETDLITPFSTKAGADAEGARQMAFLGGPLAFDQLQVKGKRADLIGKPIVAVGSQLGYDAGVPVFVMKAEEQDGGVTLLTVARKLV